MDHARTEPEQSYMYMKIINILDKFINQQSEGYPYKKVTTMFT